MTLKESVWVGAVEPVNVSEVSDAYWRSAAPTKDIGARFSLPHNKAAVHAGPAIIIGLECRVCGEPVAELTRTEATVRIKALAKTYGWSRDKHEAQACRECQRAEREAKRLAEFERYANKYSGAPTSAERIERQRHLKTMPYAEFLTTPEWHKTRGRALHRAGYACQVCYSNEDLHVHHRTYVNRGSEMDSDLTVLCAECHELFHAHRKLAEKQDEPARATHQGEAA